MTPEQHDAAWADVIALLDDLHNVTFDLFIRATRAATVARMCRRRGEPYPFDEQNDADILEFARRMCEENL